MIKAPDMPISDKDELPGTVLLGSMEKRAYLFVAQSAERMQVERANARQFGVQDIRDFVFVLDGERVELSYEDLKRRLLTPNAEVRGRP